ncbi:MAG: hypothetical protein HZA90_27530 [Verrucomicrobia bacterium]|nr:hypothetical protein [Verrucomicrobiota bacterium]
MNQQRTPSRIRPGLVVVLTLLLAAIAVPVWMQMSKPSSGNDGAESTGGEPGAVAASEVASTATANEKVPGESAAAAAPASPGPGAPPTVAATPAAPEAAAGVPPSEYQGRVSQLAGFAYDLLVKPEVRGGESQSNTSAAVQTPAGARNARVGMRNYQESDRVRKALSEELRKMRRAAIVEANRPATNR